MSRLQRIVSAIEVERLQDHVKQLTSSLRQSEMELRDARAIREKVFGLVRPAISIPKWVLKIGPTSNSEHLPVVVLSDFHWGESIDSERMGGANEYTIAVAQKRYRRVIAQTIDIAKNHLPRNTYPGIITLRLGDMVSGEIHADLRESNEQQPIPALRSLVETETWGLGQLAEAFGRVHVINVNGNHARTTLKPQSKRGAHDSFDALSSWWLESIFRDDKRMTFYTPASGDALFAIYGRRYLATHGDRIGTKGGQGFVGPAATIVRGMKLTHDQYAAQGMPLAGMFIGHFHTALALDYGWSNGSLPGWGEFARDGRMRPAAPIQWLIFFHPRYGPTSQWQVRAAEAPTAPVEQKPFEVQR